MAKQKDSQYKKHNKNKTSNVIKLQAPFENLKNYNHGEMSLFRSIILQAIIDASDQGTKSTLNKITLEANSWLYGNSEDFEFICDCADLEPSFVRKIAKALKNLNHPSCNSQKRWSIARDYLSKL